MTLYEEGRFFLTDPVARYLPEFADLPVAMLSEATSPDDIPTERARRPVTIQDLLRHTSGLTYGSFSNSVVDQLYRSGRVGGQPTLADMVTEMGKIPLMYQPRNPVALQPLHRRAGPPRGSRLGPVLRCLSARKNFRAPRYGRYRVLRAGLKTQSFCTQLRTPRGRPNAHSG